MKVSNIAADLPFQADRTRPAGDEEEDVAAAVMGFPVYSVVQACKHCLLSLDISSWRNAAGKEIRDYAAGHMPRRVAIMTGLSIMVILPDR